MNVINEAFQWFVKAKTDLHAAAILVDTSEDKFCDLICFLSQQAAEKSLKGYLVSQGIIPPRTHDLIRLRIMCAKFDLSVYAVDTRYPGQEVNTEKDVPFTLNQAKKINTFCFSRFQALLPKETNLPNSEKPEQIQTTSPSGENNLSDDKKKEIQSTSFSFKP